MKISGISILFFAITLFTSCELFQPKEPAKTLAESYLKEMQWNAVDQYPLFEGCEENTEAAIQRSCFEKTLFDLLYTELSTSSIIVNKSINDTVLLHFTIDREGRLLLTKVDRSNLVNEQIPQLEALLQQSLKKLPKLYAGLKKVAAGDIAEMVPVEVSCTLPLVIKAN